jgi:biopolymer transport protein ExbD
MRHVPIVEYDNPIDQMNTTPLIDVMLVLLIMFIITIPIQTHAIKLDLPNGPPPRILQPRPLVNEIGITKAGGLLWNGSPMSEAAVRAELRFTQQMRPVPELHLRPDPEARYEVVDKLLATIKQEQVEKVGFVGNERYLSN